MLVENRNLSDLNRTSQLIVMFIDDIYLVFLIIKLFSIIRWCGTNLSIAGQLPKLTPAGHIRG